MALRKIRVATGIFWVEVPEADLRVLCGCPADAVKHLMKRGLVVPTEVSGVPCETGPNAILLADELLQGGSFCNLSEFPVLQMLYRQGMMIPDHPNNTGRKPLIIGNAEQVDSQIRYLRRGNYGLLSEEELMEAGADAETARRLMRIKLKYAFGAIRDPSEFLDTLRLGDTFAELPGSVRLERLGTNRFRFHYDGDTVDVDLSLPVHGTYDSPYPLGYHDVPRGYFSVLHCGDGDGWDQDRPCMGSILMFQGKVYLIDAGPNITTTLNSLGIGINEVRGIFHTHCHDDHFAGLTELFRSDQRLKYFATPLVHHSVSMKFSALMGVHEDRMAEFFDIVPLTAGEWNDIDGLQVKPSVSPHPVETNIFAFRAHWSGGHRSYAHLADICSVEVLEGMVTADPTAPGIDRAESERVKEDYFAPATVKKVDIGGGMIHGNARDFINDDSEKIILSHVARPLSDAEKAIGSGAPFGTIDELIPAGQDYLSRYAFESLSTAFHDVPLHEMRLLMNNEMVPFNPQSILLRENTVPDHVHFVVTGNVEVINQTSGVQAVLSSGALIGEMTGLHGLPSSETYHARSFVRTLRIPVDLYLDFVRRNDLFGEISRLLEHREFLQRTWLCGEIVSTPTLNRIAQTMHLVRFPEGAVIEPDAFDEPAICFISEGQVRRMAAEGDKEFEVLRPGEFFGEETTVFWTTYSHRMIATTAVELYCASPDSLAAVPRVRWRLFETYQRRKAMVA